LLPDATVIPMLNYAHRFGREAEFAELQRVKRAHPGFTEARQSIKG
jgi:hypothetical protein